MYPSIYNMARRIYPGGTETRRHLRELHKRIAGPEPSLHVRKTRYLEVVADGRRAGPGEPGEVVLTSGTSTLGSRPTGTAKRVQRRHGHISSNRRPHQADTSRQTSFNRFEVKPDFA